MPAILPREIQDAFIDMHRGDTTTLMQCALTCHGWLPRSRYNLYFTVVLRRYDQVVKLARTLRSSDEVCPLVKELVILPRREPRDLRLTRLVNSVLKRLAGRIPRVQKLTITLPHPQKRGWSILNVTPFYAARIAQLSTVTHLALLGPTLGSFVDLTRMVAALPRLSVLECRNLDWYGFQGRVAPDWPFWNAGWLNLVTLVITGTRFYMPGLSTLFRAVNPDTIRSLTIDFCATRSEDNFGVFVEALRGFLALETLGIVDVRPPSLDAMYRLHGSLGEVLGVVTSPRLRRISLDVTNAVNDTSYNTAQTVEQISSGVDALLARPLFENVTLEIGVDGEIGIERWWMTAFAKALPMTHERGSLKFVVHDPRTDLAHSGIIG